jgi:subtilase family serine protease
MYGHDWHHSGQGVNAKRGISEPVPKWSADQAVDSWGTTLGRFRNAQTGQPFEFDSVVYAHQGSVYIREGETGALMWQLDVTNIDNTTVGELVHSTVALWDLNTDGNLDLILGVQRADDEGRLYAFEPVINHNDTAGYWWNASNYDQSEKLWEYNTQGDLFSSSPAIKDINGDNYLDVIMGVGGLTASDTGYVLGLNGTTGSKLFSANVSGRMISAPAVLEYTPSVDYILCAAINTSSYTVYNFNIDGSENWKKSYTLATSTYLQVPAPVVGDFNSATGYEIGVCIPFRTGNNGQVTVLRSSNGAELWTAPVTVNGQIESTPAVMDINGDNQDDLIVVSKPLLSTNVYTYALDGSTSLTIWSRLKIIVGVVNFVVAQPTITDVLKDGNEDVLIAAGNNLWALNGSDGDWLWNFTTGAGHVYETSPAVGDIDQDDFLDIAIDGMAITQRIVDLTLTPNDILFNPPTPVENQEGEVTAKITNQGKNTALDVWISFYDNGELIGSDFLDEIIATRTASVYWAPDEGGTRNITVIADPNGTVAEINESNNQASKDIDVEEVFSDLTVAKVRYFRPDGKEVDNLQTHLIAGLPATVEANVTNIGDDEALNITLNYAYESVTFSDNLSIPELQPGHWIHVNASWLVPEDIDSPTTMVITVDPGNLIVEKNDQTSGTNNNIFSEEIEIAPKDATGNVFMIQGQVFRDDEVTYVPYANIVVTNKRTAQQIFNISSDSGTFNIDLSTVPNGYYEGDTIEVFASDPSGGYSNSTDFIVYSEDGNIQLKIIISEVEQYNFQFEIKPSEKGIDPAQTIEYYLVITNLGNRENHINITLGNPYGSSGQDVEEWTFDLKDDYIILSEGGDDNITLAVTAPGPENASAGSYVDLMVSAKSDDDPTIVHSVQTKTTVNSYYGLSVLQESIPKIDPNSGTKDTLGFTVENIGNQAMSGSLRASVTSEMINISSLPSSFSLAVAQKTDMSMDIEVNTSLAPGSYPISLIFTDSPSSKEFTKSVIFDLVLPDLVIEDTDIIVPTTVKIGTAANITVRVSNIGTSDAKEVMVVLKRDDIDIAQSTIDVEAGSSKNLFFQVSIEKQSFNLKAHADRYNAIFEMDETNNIGNRNYTVQFDIKGDGLTHTPHNPRPGDSVNLTVSFSNPNLNTDFDMPFQISFYIHNLSEANSIGTVRFTEPLSAGKSYERTLDWVVPAEMNGTVTVYARLDSLDEVAESSETNNNLTTQITFATGGGGDDDDSTPFGGSLWIIVVAAALVVVALIAAYFFFGSKEEKEEEKKKEEGEEEEEERVEGPETIEIEIEGDSGEPEDLEDDEDESEEEAEEDEDEYIEMELVDDEDLEDEEYEDDEEYSGEDDEDVSEEESYEEEEDLEDDEEVLEVEPMEDDE